MGHRDPSTGTVTPNGIALSNPPGPAESPRDHGGGPGGAQYHFLSEPGATIGHASFSLVGVQFTHPKTFEVRTYSGDLAVTASDFNAGDVNPALSLSVTNPTELTITLDVTDTVRQFAQRDAPVIGFNLRESESPGNALIATEWVFVATILVLGIITGLTEVRQGVETGSGIPDPGRFAAPQLTVLPVPEPSTLLLFILAAATLIVVSRHYRGRGQRHPSAVITPTPPAPALGA